MNYINHVFTDTARIKTFIISPSLLICKTDQEKCSIIQKVKTSKFFLMFQAFKDAEDVRERFVILENLERIIEYTPIGPKYNCDILHTILVLVESAPSTVQIYATIRRFELMSSVLECLDPLFRRVYQRWHPFRLI